MPRIDKTQQYIARRQMQQEEANAAIPDPKVVSSVGNAAPSVARNNIPPATPSSAIDTGAPVASPAAVQQSAKIAPPVIPDLAVAPGGPTSPMNEKPTVTITDPTDTKLVSSSLPDITTESFEEAMKRGKYTPAQWLYENEKAAKEGRREPLNMVDYAKVMKYGDMDETPESKAKRERREQVSHAISGLGNLIANAANLAFTTKGAVPMDLNGGMKELDERQQRIKAKRDALKEKGDALILDAGMGDIKYARSLEAAKEKAAAERAEKIEQRAFELQKQNANLSAQAARDKARMEFDGKHKDAALAQKAKHDRAMEGIGWKNANTAAERAKQAKENKPDKFAASFDGKYGSYRFKDKDRASAIASRTVSMIKESAQKKGDTATVNEINDAYADLKNPSVALEFVRQKVANYPEAEMYIAKNLDKKLGDVAYKNEAEINNARHPKKTVLGFGGNKPNDKKKIPGF